MDADNGDPHAQKFVVSDDPKCHFLSVSDLEQRLFGLFRQNNREQEISDSEFVPIKS